MTTATQAKYYNTINLTMHPTYQVYTLPILELMVVSPSTLTQWNTHVPPTTHMYVWILYLVGVPSGFGRAGGYLQLRAEHAPPHTHPNGTQSGAPAKAVSL